MVNHISPNLQVFTGLHECGLGDAYAQRVRPRAAEGSAHELDLSLCKASFHAYLSPEPRAVECDFSPVSADASRHHREHTLRDIEEDSFEKLDRELMGIACVKARGGHVSLGNAGRIGESWGCDELQYAEIAFQ